MMQNAAKKPRRGDVASSRSKTVDYDVVRTIYRDLFADDIWGIFKEHSTMNGNTFVPSPLLISAGLLSIFLLSNPQEELAITSSGRLYCLTASPPASFNTSHHQSLVALRLFTSPEYHFALQKSPTSSGGYKPVKFGETVLQWTPDRVQHVSGIIAFCVRTVLHDRCDAFSERASEYLRSFLHQPEAIFKPWKMLAATVAPIATLMQPWLEWIDGQDDSQYVDQWLDIDDGMVPDGHEDENPTSPEDFAPLEQSDRGQQRTFDDIGQDDVPPRTFSAPFFEQPATDDAFAGDNFVDFSNIETTDAPQEDIPDHDQREDVPVSDCTRRSFHLFFWLLTIIYSTR